MLKETRFRRSSRLSQARDFHFYIAKEKALFYRHLRRKVRAQIKLVEAAFDKHSEAWNCRLDSNNCRNRAAYQERLATLSWVYKELLRGHLNDDDGSLTTISDLCVYD